MYLQHLRESSGDSVSNTMGGTACCDSLSHVRGVAVGPQHFGLGWGRQCWNSSASGSSSGYINYYQLMCEVTSTIHRRAQCNGFEDKRRRDEVESNVIMF